MSSSSSPSPPSFKDPGLLSSSSSLANNASIMAVEGGPKILARLPLGQCHWKLVISFNHWHYHINHDWSISTTISIESTTRCSSTLAIMSDASGYLQVTSMPLLDLSSWHLILDVCSFGWQNIFHLLMYSLMALYIHQKTQLMCKKGNFANYTGSSFRQHDENVEHLLKTTVTEQPRCLGIMFCCDMFCKLKNSDFRLKCSLLNEYVARNSKGNFFSPQRQHLGTKLTKQKMTLISRYKGQLLGGRSAKKFEKAPCPMSMLLVLLHTSSSPSSSSSWLLGQSLDDDEHDRDDESTDNFGVTQSLGVWCHQRSSHHQ